MTNPSDSLVSVIMPTYRRADTLARAIDSVLSQTYKNLELIVVNDNGADGEFTPRVREIVGERGDDGRLTLLEPTVHKNGAFARNRGIEEARGEFVAFLDDDDWWEPEKLVHQMEAFDALGPEWGILSCRIKRYDGDRLIAVLPKYADGLVCKDILMLAADYATGTLVIRRSCLDEMGCFDESLTRHQDLQLLIRLTSKYKLMQLDEPLHCCDVRDDQNRLGADALIDAKRALFDSVSDVYGSLSFFERRSIALSQRAEIGRIRYKEGGVCAASLTWPPSCSRRPPSIRLPARPSAGPMPTPSPRTAVLLYDSGRDRFERTTRRAHARRTRGSFA